MVDGVIELAHMDLVDQISPTIFIIDICTEISGKRRAMGLFGVAEVVAIWHVRSEILSLGPEVPSLLLSIPYSLHFCAT